MKKSPQSVRHSTSRRQVLAEALESRLFLSAAHGAGLYAMGAVASVAVSAPAAVVAGPNYDLVPSIGGLPTFSGPYVTGTSITAKLKVTVTNIGTNISPATPEAVTLSLRPAGGTGSTDINITTTAGTVDKVSPLKPATANLSLTIPATLPSGLAFHTGTYSLILKVAGGNAGVDSIVASSFTITDSIGAVNLGASIGAVKFPTIVSGTAFKGGSISFTVTNAGNIPTSLYPAVNIAVTLSNGSTTFTLVSQANQKLVTLKAVGGKKGSTKDTYTVKIPAIPAAETAAIPAGTYSVQITITPVAAAGAAALPPIVISGPSITVSGGTTTGGTIFKHGDTITFNADTQLTGSNFLELGSFVTNTGATGSYRFSPAGLTLTYSTGDSDSVLTSFVGAQDFLDPTVDGIGQKVIFSTDATNGFLLFLDSKSVVSYAKYG